MNRNVKLFITGALGYPLLEVLWRGRTHITMSAAGGTALVALDKIAASHLSLIQKCAAGALFITGLEASIGLTFNRRHQIWDYRHMPLNWKGQISLHYTLAWGLMTLAVVLTQRKKRLP